MAGAGFFRLPFWVFLKTMISTLILVGFLVFAQKMVFPNAVLFFNPYNLKADVAYSQIWQQSKGYAIWTPIDNVRGVLLTSAVAPPPATEVNKTPVGDFMIVSNLHTPLLHMSMAGTIAAAAWVLMLGAGVWGAIRSIPHRSIAVPIVVYVLFQTLLHSVYGEITFLYAGNFFPALFFLTAFGYFTPLRRTVLGASVIFSVFGGLNNQAEFSKAVRLSSEVAAHLAVTGTAICVPTCEITPQSSRGK